MTEFKDITATVFSGFRGAYGRIKTGSLYVALPHRFKERPLPWVVVTGPKGSVNAQVQDIGPWNIEDQYWLTPTGRPQAESGHDLGQVTHGRPRKTNKAGIDLSPALARAVGIDGKGLVSWRFLETS